MRGITSVSSAESPQTVIAENANGDGIGPMNFRYPVPSGPLEALAASQTNTDSKLIADTSVTSSRHLKT